MYKGKSETVTNNVKLVTDQNTGPDVVKQNLSPLVF